MAIILTLISSSIIGTLIGWSGIAGFLLPIFLTGYLNLDPTTALCISFASFLLSGIIGSFGYYKYNLLDLKLSKYLIIGSLIGSVIGVFINSLVESFVVNIFLYMVVLISGISILHRIYKEKNNDNKKYLNRIYNMDNYKLFIFGFLTSIVCSLSGAGGPILVMPILVLWGLETKKAVALALFDSIFIAIPSVMGYWLLSDIKNYYGILIVTLIAHGIGVIVGINTSKKVNQFIIKLCVGVFSVIVALWKLIDIFI